MCFLDLGILSYVYINCNIACDVDVQTAIRNRKGAEGEIRTPEAVTANGPHRRGSRQWECFNPPRCELGSATRRHPDPRRSTLSRPGLS